MTTAIAMFIGMRFDLRSLFWLSGWTLVALVFASMANLGSAMAPANHPVTGNFIGVFISKNAFGQRAIEFATISTFAVLLLRDAPASARAVFLTAAACIAYMITIAGSATASALTLVVVVLSAGLYGAMQIRSGLLVVVPLVLLAAAAAVVVLFPRQSSLSVPVLDLLGRDPTMTGRTVLWDFGVAAWLDRPLLGFGAGGFWDNPAYLARIDVIQRLYGETVRGFHSLPIELLVTLGPLGLVAHAAIGLRAVRDAIIAFRRHRNAYAIWALMMVLMLYAQAFVGPHLYIPHSLPLILLLAIAGALGTAARAGGGPRAGNP
jgi:exopolysaccharide production protein ExoQ